MEKGNDPAFVQARDEALRGLALGCGLNAAQISALLLHQLHLATNTLRIDLSDFAGVDSPFMQPATLDLDADTRQVLISWLVLRPDGTNNHVFPGDKLAGLAPEIIHGVISTAKKPAGEKGRMSGTSSSSDSERKTSSSGGDDQPAGKMQGSSEATDSVSLEEIELLREQLAAVEGDWSSPVNADKGRSPSAATRAPKRPGGAPIGQTASTQGPAPDGESPSDTGESGGRQRREPARRAPSGPPEPMPHATRAPKQVTGDGPHSNEDAFGDAPASLRVPPMLLLAVGVALVLVCCVAALIAGGVVVGGSDASQLLAGVLSPDGDSVEELVLTEQPETQEEVVEEIPTTDTPVMTDTPTVTPAATATQEPVSPEPVVEPTAIPPTWTPVIVVVTATSPPEPSATSTRPATNTPVVAAATPTTPADTEPPAYRYPAPELLEPSDGGMVAGRLGYLKWESLGPLADNEWYALRLVFLQQGQPMYNGDRLKATDWRLPERFYYQADGPALQYEWFVFVEQDNPDGSTTQISPESQHFFFRWE